MVHDLEAGAPVCPTYGRMMVWLMCDLQDGATQYTEREEIPKIKPNIREKIVVCDLEGGATLYTEQEQ